jgi:hypothetical protein
MRRLHIDGTRHRVADEKQRNPVPQSELCAGEFPFLIPNACDRRDGSGYSQQKLFQVSLVHRDDGFPPSARLLRFAKDSGSWVAHQ